MAWRALGKRVSSFSISHCAPVPRPEKKGVSASIAKALAGTSTVSVTSVSKFGAHDSARALAASVGYLRGPCHTAAFLGADKDCTFSANRWLIRYFHASPELLARRRDDESLGLKTSKRVKVVNSGKFSKRKKEAKPPVEAPYIPPKLTRATKSLPDKTIEIFEGITIGELAKRCGESAAAIQNIIINVGEKADSEFDALSVDIAELVAMEVGVNVRRLHSDEGVQILPRPPVVTVMGHVDHGKTSLLDALRQTSLAAKEAGGITQHLGAFVVGMQSGASITFLDTPGHAAFSAMRARGAAVTDVVVLVVAADDGVMPQTLEAMNHAKAANVPIVVAVNKCDKPDANPERVKVQLASEGLPLEEMGGDVQVVEVSAINKTGLDKLEEALLLQAELMDLKARIDGPAQAYVVEARVDKGRGPLATAIVKAGTLVCGQHVVVGAQWGRIRCIRDMARQMIAQATPAMPVEIEGLKGLPMAGDDIVVVESEERARMLSEGRKKKIEKDRLIKLEEERQKLEEERQKASEDNENEDEEETSRRVEVPIIVKADVQGTVQAVSDALKSLNSPQVCVKVVHAGVGPVTQSDVDMAQACGACIVGFNVRDLPTAISLAAAQAKIKIKLHRIIYHLLEDIGNLIVEKAPGTLETKVAGEAQVLNIFELKGRSKAKGDDVKIAGCRVIDGRLTKSATLRLLRSGEVVFEGCCTSLKREQQDVDAVGKGNECGLVIKDCFDFQVGDVIQCLVKVNRKPKFISSESGAVRIEC
ncbi:Mitochondrial translation initiation factor [Handroanthus impetiginosus]|uniref:Translation initiation factor IF-2, mitochondrial n=1 Tax=Handroanthus impetiginosus TaxID=429701 RepID=A0A2G9I621_9LAMI|nr:Mitochondrial translation initiation factor [Handroanthus impetiginosus]